MTFSADTPLERTPDAMISSLTEEGLVGLSMATDRCYSMNATATRIWDLLENPASAQAIADQLCAEFDGPADQVAASVASTLQSFADEGLVRVACES